MDINQQASVDTLTLNQPDEFTNHHHPSQSQPGMPHHPSLKQASSIIDLNNLHQDLSIKKERGPPSLRKKQSQRFTVAHNNNNSSAALTTEPVPPLPNLSTSHTLSSPSISSMGDSDQNNPFGSISQGSYNLSNPSSTTTAAFTSPGSPGLHLPGINSSDLTRSGTNQSGGGVPGNLNAHTMPPGAIHCPNPASGNDQDDEVIPTAIVIKNIPFTVKREQLLAIIEDLMIPAPYAFNYHFDNGIFRGLAFANFRSASEADAAVAGLNGFDITGRKLRVEYKKVLQAGEKERIEKEKAIKRMRSMQLQKESMFDQYQVPPPIPPMSSSSTNITFGSHLGHDEDYRPQFRSNHSYGTQNHHLPSSIPHRPSQTVLNASHHHLQSSYGSTGSQSYQTPQQAFENLSISGGESTKPTKDLDMNDPQTLEFYSRVLIFKGDNFRDELAFPSSLSGAQRRIVHQVAKKLGLEHRSEGAGDERFVVVTKPGACGQQVPPGSHRMSRVASSANMNRGAGSHQAAKCSNKVMRVTPRRLVSYG